MEKEENSQEKKLSEQKRDEAAVSNKSLLEIPTIAAPVKQLSATEKKIDEIDVNYLDSNCEPIHRKYSDLTGQGVKKRGK